MTTKLALALVLAAMLPMAATAVAAQADSATTVWRCGADGRSYGDAPCAGGRAVDVADSRSAEQVAAARAVLAADLRRAEAMRRERLERERHEAKHAQRVPVSLSPAKAPLNPAAVRRAGLAKVDPLERAPRASKPKLARAQRPSSSLPEADGIWQAAVPASPRAPG